MTNFTFHFYISFLALSFLAVGCTESQNPKEKLGANLPSSNERTLKILILGDSLTEGYGVMNSQCYPTLLEKKLNSEISPITNTQYELINGGSTGSTSSEGLNRIQWLLRANPDYFILALGGNDGLRGIPSKETRRNLSLILEKVQNKKIPMMLAGMQIPPNYGPEYTQAFAEIFPSLAKEFQIRLIPFLLDGVGGDPKFNLPDRIHPNPAGHQKICDLVFSFLSKELKQISPNS